MSFDTGYFQGYEFFEFMDMVFCSNCREYKGVEYNENEDLYSCVFCQ